MLGEERCAGNGRVEHKLMKLGVVLYSVLDRHIDVLRRVLLQTDDA